VPTLRLCVLYGSQNKQQLLPYKTLRHWFLQPKWRMFTARYALNPYIKHTRFVFKGLIWWRKQGEWSRCVTQYACGRWTFKRHFVENLDKEDHKILTVSKSCAEEEWNFVFSTREGIPLSAKRLSVSLQILLHGINLISWQDEEIAQTLRYWKKMTVSWWL
jgi:hypothetical protein